MKGVKQTVKSLRNTWHNDLHRPDILLESVLSYCQNEFAGDSAKETDMYKYISEIHSLTKIHSVVSNGYEKCRVGRERDGGYVMVKPFSREKIAYSLGIAADVSWDLEMADADYQIYQYDHTINALPEQNKSFHWKKVGVIGGRKRSS